MIIYLRWLRYLIDVTLRDKVYVVVNVDETSVSLLTETNNGYVSEVLRVAGRCQNKRPAKADRTNTKTTLMGVVADQGALQSYLPQVIMPRYTQNARPPAWLRAAYARQGFPLQFWHGTTGASTPTTFRRWINVLRGAVHSFNSDAWILLIMDCHSSHLDLNVIQHLGRLGILTVIIPAKLTWLLQPLDVYVYADLKRTLRHHLADVLLTHAEMTPGSWIAPTAAATRSSLVRTDWSEHFDRLGAGLDLETLRDEIGAYLEGAAVVPGLPKCAELAQIMNRRHHTDGTKRLHAALMEPAIRIRDLSEDAKPPCGACVHLPVMPPAIKRRKADDEPDGGWAAQVREHLVRQSIPDPLGGIVGPEAVQVTIPRGMPE